MSLEDAVIAWEQAVATQNTILVELSHRCQTIEAKLDKLHVKLDTLSGMAAVKWLHEDIINKVPKRKARK
jgi:uncharacterized coiled-coil protein SlyX